MPTLPQEVQRGGVTTKKQSPDITMVAHLFSPDASLDAVFASKYALLQIRGELARLDGVGDINVFGAREYSMRIWLDPEKSPRADLPRRTWCSRFRSRTCRSPPQPRNSSVADPTSL